MSCAINIAKRDTAMFLRNTIMLYVATTHKKCNAAPAALATTQERPERFGRITPIPTSLVNGEQVCAYVI